MAGSRLSNDVTKEGTSCHLLVLLSSKFPSFFSKLGGKNDHQPPQAHTALELVLSEEDREPSAFVEWGWKFLLY